MSDTLRRIEGEIAHEVLHLLTTDALAMLDATEHRDECLAFLHVVIRRTSLRYNPAALPLEEARMFGPRGGLSAPTIQAAAGNGSPHDP
jgi:hypothetical protein